MVKVLLKTMVMSILFLILLSSEVYALNMGSVAKNKIAEISIGESAKFKMLFWNTEDESYTMKLSIKEAPKDWTIMLDPSEFVLKKTIGEEYINLPYTNEIIKAKIVNLFVKPASNSKSGKYFVTIKAEPRLSQNEIGDINVIPARLLKFEIDLKSLNIIDSMNISGNQKNTIEFSGNGFDYEGENLEINNAKNENQIDKKYFYFIILFMIVLISITIYKKY